MENIIRVEEWGRPLCPVTSLMYIVHASNNFFLDKTLDFIKEAKLMIRHIQKRQPKKDKPLGGEKDYKLEKAIKRKLE